MACVFTYEDVDTIHLDEPWPPTEEEQAALLKSFRLQDWTHRYHVQVQVEHPCQRTRLELNMPSGPRSFDVLKVDVLTIMKPVTYETVVVNCRLQVEGSAIHASLELLSGQHIWTLVYEDMNHMHLQLSELQDDAYDKAVDEGLIDSSGQDLVLLLQGNAARLRDETLLVWAGGPLTQANLEAQLNDLHAEI